MCLLRSTNWGFISQKTPFLIIVAVLCLVTHFRMNRIAPTGSHCPKACSGVSAECVARSVLYRLFVSSLGHRRVCTLLLRSLSCTGRDLEIGRYSKKSYLRPTDHSFDGLTLNSNRRPNFQEPKKYSATSTKLIN
jgi:hypothetical protein